MELWCLILIGLGVAYLYHQLVARRKGLPPGPVPLPFIGNVLSLDPKRGIDKCIDEISQKYGPISTVWIGNVPNIMMTDYDHLREYFVGGKTADIFSGRPTQFTLTTFYGKENAGVVFSHGDKWREQRRFSLHTMRDFGFGRSIMEDGIREQTDELIRRIRDLRKENGKQMVDMAAPLMTCVTNIISKICFGRTFPHDSPTVKAIRKGIDENFEAFATLPVFLLQNFEFLRYIPLFQHFGYDIIKRNADIFWGVLDKEFQAIKDSFDPANEPLSYAEAYLKEIHTRKASGQPMGSFTEFQAVRAMGDFWSAGFETTVTTLRWAFTFMILYPDVQEKVRQEITAYYTDEHKVVEMADRQNLPYTAATVMEIQRQASVIPLNIQHTNTEEVKVEGYTFPKGTCFVPQIASVMANGKYFPDPDSFKPERFIEDGKLKNVPEFMPFSLGKRMCAGEALARTELFIIFTMVMRAFKMSVPPGEKPPRKNVPAGVGRKPDNHFALILDSQ